MTFNILLPLTIGASAIDYTNTTETEDPLSALAPYAAYSAATNYASGVRVYSATTHKVYQSLQAANLNHDPTVAANIGVWWADAGATNTYRPFDQITNNQCQKSGSNIRYRLTCSAAVSAVALLGLIGTYVSVMHYDTDAVRRNLITYSADPSNAAYTSTNATITANSVQDHLSGPLGAALQETVSGAVAHTLNLPSYTFTSGLTYTFSTYIKRIALYANRDVYLQLPAAAFGGPPQVIANLTTLGLTNSGGATSTITAAGNGYYRLTITATATSNTAGRAVIGLYNAATSYVGLGNAGLYVSGSQLEQAGTATNYQWIEDATRWGDVLFAESQIISAYVSNNSSEVIFTGLTADAGDFIDITVNPDVLTSIAGLSEIAMGQSYPIGDTADNPKIGSIDYSNTTVDTFGNTTLVRRGFAITADYTIRIARTNVAQIRNFLNSMRAQPVLFYDDVDVSNDVGTSKLGLLVFGLRLNFDIAVTRKPILTLNVRGL